MLREKMSNQEKPPSEVGNLPKTSEQKTEFEPKLVEMAEAKIDPTPNSTSHSCVIFPTDTSPIDEFDFIFKNGMNKTINARSSVFLPRMAKIVFSNKNAMDELTEPLKKQYYCFCTSSTMENTTLITTQMKQDQDGAGLLKMIKALCVEDNTNVVSVNLKVFPLSKGSLSTKSQVTIRVKDAGKHTLAALKAISVEGKYSIKNPEKQKLKRIIFKGIPEIRKTDFMAKVAHYGELDDYQFPKTHNPKLVNMTTFVKQDFLDKLISVSELRWEGKVIKVEEFAFLTKEKRREKTKNVTAPKTTTTFEAKNKEKKSPNSPTINEKKPTTKIKKRAPKSKPLITAQTQTIISTHDTAWPSSLTSKSDENQKPTGPSTKKLVEISTVPVNDNITIQSSGSYESDLLSPQEKRNKQDISNLTNTIVPSQPVVATTDPSKEGSILANK